MKLSGQGKMKAGRLSGHRACQQALRAKRCSDLLQANKREPLIAMGFHRAKCLRWGLDKLEIVACIINKRESLSQ